MPRLLIVVGLMQVLAGCASLSVDNPEVTRLRSSITAEQESEAVSALLTSLKAPDSARIASIYGTREPHEVEASAVCGTLNAHNSYGGYGGGTYFSVHNGRALEYTQSPLYGVPNSNIEIFNLCTTTD